MLFPAKNKFGIRGVGIAFAAAATAVMVGLSNPASAEQRDAFGHSSQDISLKVTVDRAKVVRIAKPANTVIIGNPAIVDATIQDSRTLFLTGRSFGVTNLIVLDGDGQPIIDETVVVKGHEVSTVRVYRRAVRETLACAPVCEPTLTIGDDIRAFTNAERQIRSRNRMAESGG